MEQESGKRTLWHWASWIWGVSFLFFAVMTLVVDSRVIATLAALGIAALLLPPVRAWTHQKTGYSLPVWGRALAVVVLMAAVVPPPDETARQPQGQAVEKAPAAPAGAAEVFTKANLRSYRVFENVRPGEEFHRIDTNTDPQTGTVLSVVGRMTFWDGVKKISPGIELRANIEILRPIGNSHLDDDCGLDLGVRTKAEYLLPEYDAVVGEESYSWINCRKGRDRERAIHVTSFVRDGVVYTVSIWVHNQGFPSDLSHLDTTLEVARDWDAKIRARAKQEIRV